MRTVWLTNLSANFADFVVKGFELSDPVEHYPPIFKIYDKARISIE